MGQPYWMVQTNENSWIDVKIEINKTYVLLLACEILCLLMFLYPPWVIYSSGRTIPIGYYSIWDYPSAPAPYHGLKAGLDLGLLFWQWVLVVLAGLWVHIRQDQMPSNPSESEDKNWDRAVPGGKSLVELVEDDVPVQDNLEDESFAAREKRGASPPPQQASLFDAIGEPAGPSQVTLIHPSPLEPEDDPGPDDDHENSVMEPDDEIGVGDDDEESDDEHDDEPDECLWELASGLEEGEIEDQDADRMLVEYLSRDDLSPAGRFVCRAMVHHSMVNWGAAGELFAEAEEADPYNALTYYFRSRHWRDREEYIDAHNDLDTLVERSPADYSWLAFLARGKFQYENQQYESAEADFTEVINLLAEDWEPYYLRGLARAGQERFEKAVEDFSKALQYDAPDPDLIFTKRGHAYVEMDRIKEALQDFHQVIMAYPFTSQPGPDYCRDAYYYRGVIEFNQKDFSMAIMDFSCVIKHQPDYGAEVYFMRGKAFYLTREFQKALGDFNRAVPHDSRAYVWRSCCLFKLNYIELALQDIESVKQMLRTTCSYFEWETVGLERCAVHKSWGFTYLANQNYPAALDEFDQVLKLDPRNAEAYHNRGEIYLRLARQDRKEKNIKTELLIGSDKNCDLVITDHTVASKHARIFRHYSVLMIEDLGSANGTYIGNYSRRLPPYIPTTFTNSDAVILGSYTLALNSLTTFGFFEFEAEAGKSNYGRAIKDFSWAIQYGSDSYAMYHLRAETYYELGLWDQAIDDLTHLAKNNTDDPRPLANRARIYAKLKKHDLAIQDYTRAIELEHDKTGQAYYYHHRGLSLKMDGKSVPAAKDFAMARQLDPQTYSPPKRQSQNNFKLPGRLALECLFNDHVVNIVENLERCREMGINFPAPIALHGPPGCGKTYAVNALVKYLGWPSFSITSGSVGNMYIHETPRLIASVFDKAKAQAPAVVIIDEMDAFMKDRQTENRSYRNEEVAEFLRNVEQAPDNNVLVIGMTNQIQMIDPALLRRGRFDHVIKVEMPTAQETRACLAKLLDEVPAKSDLDLDPVAASLAGRPLSDVAFVVREAARLCVKDGKTEIDNRLLCQAAGIDKKTKKPASFVLTGRKELENFFQNHIIDVVNNAKWYHPLGVEFPAPVVLSGPPGCGKTFAVDALAEYLDWPCFTISAGSIGSIYIHGTSVKISEIFDKAKAQTPSLVVIDEMDAFLSSRDSFHDHKVEEVTEFLRQIQDASKNRVLVIGMTNRIEAIDSALLRRGRFDHIIKVGLPSREELDDCLNKLLSDRPCAKGLNLESLADSLAHRPLSDVAFVVREAARLAGKSRKKKIDDICIGQALKARGWSNQRVRSFKD